MHSSASAAVSRTFSGTHGGGWDTGLAGQSWGDLLSSHCLHRACVGLPPQNHMLLEHKMERPGLGIKQGEMATISPLQHKRESTPAATNGCTGDANGHTQAPTPEVSTA